MASDPKMPDKVRMPASPMAVATIRLLGTWAIVHGLGIILGGEHRWQAQAYVALDQVPGSPYIWGIFLALGGLIVMVGSVKAKFRVKNLGVYWVATWAFFFGAGLFIAALPNTVDWSSAGAALHSIRYGSTVAFTACLPYVILGCILIVLTRAVERKGGWAP